MLQFSRVKKMCCFKRATFCIIQRKVKRRYNLLVQIFIFLLRCLLNLVKVHIMLCTFKNGTIKSLILTLNMFRRFFFFIFIWHGIKNCNAEILQSLTAQACKSLARLDVQCCRNSAWYGVQWCRNSARFDVQCCRISARLDASAAEILHALTSSAAEILYALTSSAAGILHALTSRAAEILHGMTSWVKEIFCVARSMLQKSWVVAFPFSKKTNCRGPTHTNSFDQFSIYAFSIFQWS